MTEISSMTLQELTEEIHALGLPDFRARQIYQWLHCKQAADFSEMTNLDKALRQTLAQQYTVAFPKTARKLTSKIDGTVKYLFEFADGQCVEAVLMRYHYGLSICVSTQAGCAMGCRFCASTKNGKVRDLTAGEILGQVYAAARDCGERISHVVLMGIGEPLDNFDAVVRFLQMISDENGLHIGQRNLSLSTCGIVPNINRLAELELQITLSVSLHAPNDRLRSSMMPINRRYPIAQLIPACRAYAEKTGRRISFEYAMVQGVNDTPACAEELCALLRDMLCHLNLIPVNPIREGGFEKSEDRRIQAFVRAVEAHHIPVTVRRRLGADINAACGQLRREGKMADKT